MNFSNFANLNDFGRISTQEGNKIFENNKLKSAKISNSIHIDNNWSAAKAAGICTGDGTYPNPYVIEDLIIDGGGSGSCILIRSSTVHFRIENCTIYNSGQDDAGIRLDYVSNGIITNNDVLNNDQYGIILKDSNNNTVIGNRVSNNVDGIHLSRSNNNYVLTNIINNNTFSGICLYYSSNDTVLGNTASNCGYGIYLSFKGNNTVSGNTVNNNAYAGIQLFFSDNNTVLENIASENNYGIHLDNSNNNNISGNTASNNAYGIRLLQYNYKNNISGNLMNNCGLSIFGDLESLVSNYIDTSNLVNGKPLYYYTNEVNLGSHNFINGGQVILVNCNDSLISDLNISYCGIGVSFYYCNTNNISRNTIEHNHLGIYLQNSNNNTISGNNINNNIEVGINLKSSNNNTILRNIINYNYIGIRIDNSNFSSIIENNLGYNNITSETYGACIGNIFKDNFFDGINGNGNNIFDFIIIFLIVLVISLLIFASLYVYIKKIKKQKPNISEISLSQEELTSGIIPQDIESKEVEPPMDETVSIEDEIHPLTEPPPEISLVAEFNIFLSYSTLDSQYFHVKKIVELLEQYPEIDKVYYWEEDSKENIVEYMNETLQKINVFILLCSENSLKSKAVNDEWQAAFQLRKEGLLKIIPVYEQQNHIPPILWHLLNVKYSKDNFQGFIEKLYREILR